MERTCGGKLVARGVKTNESIYHGGVMQYRLVPFLGPGAWHRASYARVSISNVCYLPGISFCTGLTYRPRKVAHNYLSLLCDQRGRVSRATIARVTSKRFTSVKLHLRSTDNKTTARRMGESAWKELHIRRNAGSVYVYTYIHICVYTCVHMLPRIWL